MPSAMTKWNDSPIRARLGVQPLWLAPMAGAGGVELALAVARAGGLGALPCGMLDADTVARQVQQFREAIQAPIHLNFFCHRVAEADPDGEARWRSRLRPYYRELSLDPAQTAEAPQRRPFDAHMCEQVERLHPEVVSFHFGLPAPALLDRVKATGAFVASSATTVEEAVWLAERGCDAVIAQGAEAGGHRGMFLGGDVATQPGLFALLPQVRNAIDVPVVAAGGIGDARGIAAAITLGAAAVQLGTAFLLSDEARIHPLHRQALQSARARETAITNLFSGRPARGIVNRLMREIGPIGDDVPPFPTAGAALAPLRAAASAAGSDDFINLWAGQSASLARGGAAEQIAHHLIEQAAAMGMR